MEAEERAAQSAKLQELIRRGTPHDLQEANKLMKVMAGYDTRHKTDYRAKAAEEVGKVQQKAKVLEDMLQEYRPGDDSINSDTWEVRETCSVVLNMLISNRRTWATLWLVLILKYKGCVRRNLMIQRLSPSCSRSMIVYIGPWSDTV